MISEAQKKAIKRYQDANYEFIKVRLNKGDKEKLKAKAEKEGKSINSYILERIL